METRIKNLRLADYYNTSIDYLLYRTDEIAPYPKNTKHNHKETVIL